MFDTDKKIFPNSLTILKISDLETKIYPKLLIYYFLFNFEAADIRVIWLKTKACNI
jgi:hypothetical protein